MDETWDLVVVGAGPAGSCAALAALSVCPDLRVLLLDRAAFPRDKACGDGIAPHVLDVLAGIGAAGIADGHVPVRTLELTHGRDRVARAMRRPAWVIPRREFDARLVEAAADAGAVIRHSRVRHVDIGHADVVVDSHLRTRLLVGADGAHSLVRRATGAPAHRRTAFALRGYAPTQPEHAGKQVIVFGTEGQPSYAWSFDRGDGWANIGYGRLLAAGRSTPSRATLLDRLEESLPGTTAQGVAWKGHHLPLSGWRWPHPGGRVLLAGDAAGLINPMTGEGIYYAVATGTLAGRAAAATLRGAESGVTAGARYRGAVRSLLSRHLLHTAASAALAARPAVLTAGVRAANRDQGVFDDLVEIGLGRGLITRRILHGLSTSR